MKNLLEIINEVLENEGKNKIELLEQNMSLKNDLNMDSLDLAHLTVLIEQEYGVDIFENSIIHTISDIEKKLNG
jgi:acyl carrier protein